MKIILTQSVDTLCKSGDIVNVKPGYGRNYIIPKGLGVIATPAMIRATKQDIERKAIKEAKAKDNLKKKMLAATAEYDKKKKEARRWQQS